MITEALPLLARGLAMTLALTLVTSALALAWGLPIGLLRLSRVRWQNWIGTAYVETFRNVPALVLVIIGGFALPNAFPHAARRALFFDNSSVAWIGQITGLPVPYYAIAAVLGLSLNTSAYLAELFRAGVGAIAREHFEAARSLGATPGAVFWGLLLPQGLAAAYPAIATRLIHNMKNTALASFLTVPEFFKAIQTAIGESFRAVEFLIVAAGGYLLLAALMSSALSVAEGWLKGGRR
ncbi:MAG: amino acid ABC transporter permease [Chloroflexi bacterium]|nr:amino acid ABC transporter permease [Chloroflexota bacterium]